MIDTEKIISEYNIDSVVQRYVSLSSSGREMKGICPFHGDSDPSLMVNPKKGIFKCFSCNEGGDVIDFVQKIEKVSFRDACSIITNNSGNYIATEPVKLKEIKPEWEHVFPVDHAPASISHYRHGVPSKVWTYRSKNGGVVGFVCRFDFEDGSKEVLPFCLGKKRHVYRWRWMGFGKPRPLYNLDLIEKHSKALIVIVEGEKTADAVQAEFDPAEAIATTWIGGARGIVNADFGPLSGRDVVYWPDNDEPGSEAMQNIHGMIVNEVKSARWISVPDDLPRKWDAADKEWSVGEMLKFLKQNVTSVPSVVV